jgi:hypothetical protein
MKGNSKESKASAGNPGHSPNAELRHPCFDCELRGARKRSESPDCGLVTSLGIGKRGRCNVPNARVPVQPRSSRDCFRAAESTASTSCATSSRRVMTEVSRCTRRRWVTMAGQTGDA